MLTGKASNKFIEYFVFIHEGNSVEVNINTVRKLNIEFTFGLYQKFAESQGYQMYLTPTTNRKWTFSIFDNNKGEGITNEYRGELEPTMTKAVERLGKMINEKV